MKRVTSPEAAAELGLTLRRFQKLLLQGRVLGAKKYGRSWLIRSPVRVIASDRGPIAGFPTVRK